MCLRRRVPLLSLSFRLPFVFPQVTGNWVNSISPYGRHLLLFFCAPEISGPRTIFSLLLFYPSNTFPPFFLRTCPHTVRCMYCCAFMPHKV